MRITLRLVVIMYMREPEGETTGLEPSPVIWAGIVAALAGTILMGVLPGGVLDAARQSITFLL